MPSTTARGVTIDDLYAIGAVSEPAFSPDGSRLAWVQTRIDKDDDTYKAAIWIANGDGSDARQLTSGSDRDTTPTWSPDGASLAFVSNRKHVRDPHEPDQESAAGDGKDTKPRDEKPGKPVPHIWVIPIDGGEARQATNHPAGASSPAWAHDGKTIAFVASDEVTESDAFEPPLKQGQYADERIVNDIRYRFDGRGWLERFSHIWTVDIASGEISQRTSGDHNDADPVWLPDGRLLVTRAARHRNADPRSSVIVLIDAQGNTAPLSPESGVFASPALSPDATRVICLDGGHPGVFGENTRLALLDLTTGTCESFDAGLNVSWGDYGMSDITAGGADRPQWIDSRTVAYVASRRGETHLYAIDVDARTSKHLTEGTRRIVGSSVHGNRVAAIATEIDRPTDLFLVTDGEWTQVSRVNDAWRETVTPVRTIDLEVTSADGTAIQAWLLPPFGLDETSTAKYPLIVQIHGGPHAMYGYAMFHEMQAMASQGYGVVFCNPRGSAGYGQEFTRCTRGNWGESDMPDVMATLDAALAYPWVDGDRIGVTGGSYGGYLTNWIIGHTDRFKAAVTQRCVSNFYSFFGTSDIGFDFGTYQSGGTPWADAEKLLRHSPVSYVDRINTPLLILHSEQDLRCPIEQAEQMFVALRYLGRDVHFVRFPEEGHDLSRSGTPSRRIARLRHLIGWFDTHL